jgi:hypothetical protein
MISADYRIESSSPIASHWLPGSGSQQYLVHDRGLAVAVAAKSTTWPGGQEIRVVHVPRAKSCSASRARASRTRRTKADPRAVAAPRRIQPP